MAVYQPGRAAIATILVTAMQDDICEELLGRHKRKKCSTNMAGPRIPYQTIITLLVAWFFRSFRFSHFLAFSQRHCRPNIRPNYCFVVLHRTMAMR